MPVNKEILDQSKKGTTLSDSFYGLYCLTFAYFFNYDLYKVSHEVLGELYHQEEALSKHAEIIDDSETN